MAEKRPKLPAYVRANVERILDREARRLLAKLADVALFFWAIAPVLVVLGVPLLTGRL